MTKKVTYDRKNPQRPPLDSHQNGQGVDTLQQGECQGITQVNQHSTQKDKKINKKDHCNSLAEKVDSLKQRSAKMYKNVEKKINRVIKIIEQIEEAQPNSNSLNGNSHQQNAKKPQQLSKQATVKFLNQLHTTLVYEKPLKNIIEEFESFYTKLSHFSKELNYEEELPAQHKTLLLGQDSERCLKLQEAQNLEKLIKEHFYRNGCFQTAQNFYKPSVKHNQSPQRQLEYFKECYKIRMQILSHKKFQEAINWCSQEKLYETYQNPLQFELRIAEIKLLVGEGKTSTAFEKLQNNFRKFLPDYQKEINRLVGYVIFKSNWDPSFLLQETGMDVTEAKDKKIISEQLNQEQQMQFFRQTLEERYPNLAVSTVNIQKLAEKFTHQFWIHYNISKFDTLRICYEVGRKYQKQYFNSVKMLTEKDKLSTVLPFEINIDKRYLYHSIFVCPVTKEVLSSNDGVEYLSCGHLISESAKQKMTEVRRSNHRNRCPVCQKDRLNEIVKVSF